MRRLVLLFILLHCAACASSSSVSREGVSSPDPCVVGEPATDLLFHATGCVATIDGVPVPPDAFNAWIRMQLASPNSLYAELSKDEVLKSFMDEHITDYAASEAGFDPSDEELAKAADIPFEDFESSMRDMAEMRGVEEEEEIAWWSRKIRGVMYLCTLSSCEATEEDYRLVYEQKYLRYPVEVEVSHMLFAVDENATDDEVEAARRLAEDVSVEARLQGSDFAELARKHSDDRSSVNGGALGRFAAGSLIEPFEDAAFSLEVGEISGPVRTSYGWHIILVTDRVMGVAPTFEEFKSQSEFLLRTYKFQTAHAEGIPRLYERYDVVVMPESVQERVNP